MWFICFIVVEVIMFFVPIPRLIAKERGLKHYLSNKPCKRGSIAPRLVSSRICPCHLCIKTRRPSMNKAQANWSKRNRAHIKEYNDKYKRKNREKLKEARKIHNQNNSEKIRESRSIFYKKHKERLNLATNRYKRNNPERGLASAQRRRAAVANAKPSWNAELTDFVLLEALSLARLRKDIFNFAWHVDHMIPIKAKTVCGLHVWNNLQCLPSTMNTSKHTKLIYTNPHEWLYDIPKFFKVVYQQEIAA